MEDGLDKLATALENIESCNTIGKETLEQLEKQKEQLKKLNERMKEVKSESEDGLRVSQKLLRWFRR